MTNITIGIDSITTSNCNYTDNEVFQIILISYNKCDPCFLFFEMMTYISPKEIKNNKTKKKQKNRKIKKNKIK